MMKVIFFALAVWLTLCRCHSLYKYVVEKRGERRVNFVDSNPSSYGAIVLPDAEHGETVTLKVWEASTAQDKPVKHILVISEETREVLADFEETVDGDYVLGSFKVPGNPTETIKYTFHPYDGLTADISIYEGDQPISELGDLGGEGWSDENLLFDYGENDDTTTTNITKQ